MTILAVMQPTYMPWMGYFDLIDQADQFVLLDDVQLARQSWQTRNRIRGPNGSELMLSIPIRHDGNLDCSIAQTRISESGPWRKKHVRSIQQAYARAGHGAMASSLWEQALDVEAQSLGMLTSQAISLVCEVLSIDTPIRRSSEIAGPADRIDRLIELCRHTGANTYLSPPGAADYLQADDAPHRFEAAGISIQFQRYKHPNYDQGGAEFLSHLGIVDLLAHVGLDRALNTIRSGRRPPVTAPVHSQA